MTRAASGNWPSHRRATNEGSGRHKPESLCVHVERSSFGSRAPGFGASGFGASAFGAWSSGAPEPSFAEGGRLGGGAEGAAPHATPREPSKRVQYARIERIDIVPAHEEGTTLSRQGCTLGR